MIISWFLEGTLLYFKQLKMPHARKHVAFYLFSYSLVVKPWFAICVFASQLTSQRLRIYILG